MRNAIGRIFDNLGVLLAAVLTICGFMLLFLPWRQALAVKIVDPPKPSGEVFVNVGPRDKSKDLGVKDPAPGH
jgi:hypothetical protein